MSTTTAAVTIRPASAEEELIQQVPSFWYLTNAIGSGDPEELAECMSDVIDELTALRDEFPADWEYITGDREPEQVAQAHLAWLQLEQA